VVRGGGRRRVRRTAVCPISLILAMDTGKELPMSFQMVAEQAAKNLVRSLP
jgi:hypothetical protein